MASRKYVIVDSMTVWGQMPSWEIHEFSSVEEYLRAYKDEEDEIVDNLFRLEQERMIELPEDWEVRA